MKHRISIFFAIAAALLLAGPIINILKAPSRDEIKWREKSFLYNVDFASGFASRLLFPLGISTAPQKVIVGRDRWLYLGDEYQDTLTVDRLPPSDADLKLIGEIGGASRSWEKYLKNKGVKLFRVMVAPNKGSIYPEHVPQWALPPPQSGIDALFAATDPQIYLDLRPPLLAAKRAQPTALYYSTDTHWNHYGAARAFRAFGMTTARFAPELKWPADDVYQLTRVDPRGPGDLARFLRIKSGFEDFEPITHMFSVPVETSQHDLATDRLVSKGGNPPVDTPYSPLLVRSPSALNKVKVLWLRDSFGSAMSPLMAHTFSDVVQLHWSEAINPGGHLPRLIDEWKPDYVFVTVVERGARNPWFASFPPPALVADDGSFQPSRSATVFGVNQLKKMGSDIAYRIDGKDPFVDFAFPEAVSTAQIPYLAIELECDDGTSSVPMQLFWLDGDRGYFDEQHSLRFSFQTGRRLLDLRALPKVGTTGRIRRIRVDIDAQDSCGQFTLRHAVVGQAAGEVHKGQ